MKIVAPLGFVFVLLLFSAQAKPGDAALATTKWFQLQGQ